MVHLSDIRSLTDFLRNHKEHVARLQKVQRPEVLTINGKAALVVQDAASYQKLLEKLDHIEATEGVRRGLGQMKAGKGRPAAEFFDELKRKHKIPDAK